MNEIEKVEAIKKIVIDVYKIKINKYIQQHNQLDESEEDDNGYVKNIGLTKAILKNATTSLILDIYFGTNWDKLFDIAIEQLKLNGFLGEQRLDRSIKVLVPKKEAK